MTRQMADDSLSDVEVLRRYDSLINGCSDRYCPECQRLREIRNYVAALQAERDALRADRDEQQRLYVKRIEAKHAAWEEAVSWRDMLAEQVQVAESRAERAESALKALRGQVAGLVAACEELDSAERAWDDAPGSVQGLGDTDGRDCDGPEYQRLVRAINARDAALLAIKERMG